MHKPNPIDARTVAMLARAPSTNLHDATVLIQQFADMVASERVTKAIDEAYNRALAILDAAIEAPLISPKTYGENCVNPSETVRSEMK